MGKCVGAFEDVVMETRGTEDIVRLIEHPGDLRARKDDLRLAREIGNDIAFAILGILSIEVNCVSLHLDRLAVLYLSIPLAQPSVAMFKASKRGLHAGKCLGNVSSYPW